MYAVALRALFKAENNIVETPNRGINDTKNTLKLLVYFSEGNKTTAEKGEKTKSEE